VRSLSVAPALLRCAEFGPARDRGGLAFRGTGYRSGMDFILWLIAAILVIAGIVSLFRGAILWGIVLIVVGLLVGPGGVSIFT
jgi:hypothetical protein